MVNPPTAATTLTPSVEVTAELATTLVGAGGYTHPLFLPDDPTTTPLPGQAVLLLMGGLVEQSGLLDHAIALLEIRRARFAKLVRPGTRIRVEVAFGRVETKAGGRVLQDLTWTARDDDDDLVATVEVLMMVNEEGA